MVLVYVIHNCLHYPRKYKIFLQSEIINYNYKFKNIVYKLFITIFNIFQRNIYYTIFNIFQIYIILVQIYINAFIYNKK